MSVEYSIEDKPNLSIPRSNLFPSLPSNMSRLPPSCFLITLSLPVATVLRLRWGTPRAPHSTKFNCCCSSLLTYLPLCYIAITFQISPLIISPVFLNPINAMLSPLFNKNNLSQSAVPHYEISLIFINFSSMRCSCPQQLQPTEPPLLGHTHVHVPLPRSTVCAKPDILVGA